jgi:hypothetical protein
MMRHWIYDKHSEEHYIDNSMLPLIAAHNARNSGPRGNAISRKIGAFLSAFEMRSLLLGTLAQTISSHSGDVTERKAIHLRDLHDLYKYGLLPANAEDRLVSAGLLALPAVPSVLESDPPA